MTSSRLSVVVGEDGLELVEEPDEEPVPAASPLIQALKTFNDLRALEPPIENPPAKAKVAATLLPPPFRRKRPPMPTAELKLQSFPRTTLLPSIQPRGAVPVAVGMRAVIPPLPVRPLGTPASGTRVKPLPAVPRVERAPRPTERCVQIPPLPAHTNEATPPVAPRVCAEPTQVLPPLPVEANAATPQLEERARPVAMSAPSSLRRRRVMVAASTFSAAGIAFALLFVGDQTDRGKGTTKLETNVVALAPVVKLPPAYAVPAPIKIDVAQHEAPAPVATNDPPATAHELNAAEPVVAPKERAVRAKPSVAPDESAVSTTLAREPREPKQVRARRHSNTVKTTIGMAATCEQPQPAAKVEDLDSPFPE